MIQNSANALGAYYENVETCAESTYKNVEALKTEGEQLQEKNSLLIGLAQQYQANNAEFIELTAEQLEIMGEADAEKIKKAENYFITISELQAQSRTDIAANEDEYNAARNGVEQELRDNRIAAAQDLASTMKEITSGMTAEQIDDFARMAEQMGVEVDNGYLDFLKKTILFGDNLSNQLESGSEGAAETFIDKYVTLMNSGFTGVEQTAETSTEKVIGTIESSNSNMPKIEIKVNTPKLPKFSLNDSFDIARGIVPKIFISGWYDKGGYFNSPQIIGIAERRPEFVGAADDLESFIGKAVNNAFVRIDPALLHDIGSIGGNEAYSGSSVDFHSQITINTQKLTDAEMKRATDYISREFAKTVTGRKVGRLQ